MAKKTLSTASAKYTGTKEKDEITVSADSVTVSAKEGNDVISFTKGNKGSVSGDAGNDTFTIGKSAGKENKLYGGAGNDKFTVSGGNSNILKGGDDADEFVVNSTVGTGNKFYGDAGNDKFTIQGGNSNSYDGGTGSDWFNFLAGKNNTVVGGAGSDSFDIKGGSSNTFKGGSDKDGFYVTGGSSNTIYGEAGDDGFDIAGGSVMIDAGTGNNVMHVTGGTVTSFTSYAGADTVEVLSGTVKSALLGDGNNRVNVTNRGSVVSKLVTGSGKDTITVSYKGTVKNLYAGAGVDNINIQGVDGGTYRGEAGNDEIIVSGAYSGTVIVSGGDGNDVFGVGAAGVNDEAVMTINGDAGNDTFSTYNANVKTISGGAGTDKFIVEGSSFIKNLRGGADNDTITVDGGKIDYLNGDAGNDKIVFEGQSHTIIGSAHGGEGDDTLEISDVMAGNFYGDAGDDVITISDVHVSKDNAVNFYGGAGNDTIRAFRLDSFESKSTINLGDGRDTLEIRDSSNVSVVMGTGAKEMTVEDSYIIVNASSATTNKVTLTDHNKLTYTGSTGRDIIQADSYGNGTIREGSVIKTGAGNDYISINIVARNNYIDGGTGNDIIEILDKSSSYLKDNNKIAGGDGNDTIKVSGYNGFTLYGDAGKDTFEFFGANNSVIKDYQNGEIIRFHTDYFNINKSMVGATYTGNNMVFRGLGDLTIADGAFDTVTIQAYSDSQNKVVGTFTVKGKYA